jgi:uncharacterized protein YcbK (DUF882 family)
VIDWSLYPNFSEVEFRCRHCGKAEMKPEFLAKLQELRLAYGRPMNVSSGYRCPDHPIEKAKPEPGMHATGLAADVAVTGTDAFEIVRLGLQLGFTGLGVQQKGVGRFIHLDIRKTPMVWSY